MCAQLGRLKVRRGYSGRAGFSPGRVRSRAGGLAQAGLGAELGLAQAGLGAELELSGPFGGKAELQLGSGWNSDVVAFKPLHKRRQSLGQRGARGVTDR